MNKNDRRSLSPLSEASRFLFLPHGSTNRKERTVASCEIIMCLNNAEYLVNVRGFGNVKMCPECLSVKIAKPEDGSGNTVVIRSATRIEG